MGYGSHTTVSALFGEAYEIHYYDAAIGCHRSGNV